MIIFCRHKSGPVYLWYEIVSPALSPPAHRHPGAQEHRRPGRGGRQPGRAALAAAGALRPAEYPGQPDSGRRRPGRLVYACRSRTGQGSLQARHPDRLLRRVGQADQGGPGRSGRGRARPPPGRDVPETAGHDAGDRPQVRRQRLPAGADLPQPDEEGRLPGDDHQRLHAHDHAALGNHGLPAAEHAERRRLHGLLRIRFRRHSGGHAACETSPAGRTS